MPRQSFTMKLRLLNASHSAFAYLGYLAGHEFIYQVAAQPEFVAFMRRFTADEVTPTLAAPPGIDLAEYRETLVRRFANPALPHRTQQIAMDGSQKLPQRILATVRDNLAEVRSVELASLAVAGWMRYVYGEDEQGRPISVRSARPGFRGACGSPSRRSCRICAGPSRLARSVRRRPAQRTALRRSGDALAHQSLRRRCGEDGRKGDRPLMITLACDDEAHELAPAFAHDLAT